MISKHIDSPIRTIQLDYAEEKPLTAYETEVIARYIEIHHIHAGYEHSVDEYRLKIDLLGDRITFRKAKLLEVKKQLHELLSSTKKLNSAQANPTPELVTRMQKQTTDYNVAVNSFHEELAQLSEECTETFNAFQTVSEEWDDRFEKQLEDFDSFTDELYSNYENYQLDIERLFDDHEEFRECMMKTERKFRETDTRLEETIDRWDHLVNEATLFYDFVENQERFKGLDSIEMQN